MSLPTFRRTSRGATLPLHMQSRTQSRRGFKALGFAVLGAFLLVLNCVTSWVFAPSTVTHVYKHEVKPHGGFSEAERVNSEATGILSLLVKRTMMVAIPAAIAVVLKRTSLQSMKTSLNAAAAGMDFYLIFCFAVWYAGNYQHNIANKLALIASGGASGFPLTIAACQLAVGGLYAAFLWVAPDARSKPRMTFNDWKATLPVSFAAACAHAGSVFALSAGALSFGQILKAAEPAFAVAVGSVFYGAKLSKPRLACLVPIIGGVALSSLVELDFTWAALVAASIANLAAAFRGSENKKLFSDEGVRHRLGNVGNQFAVTTMNAFLFLAPVALWREGHKLSSFVRLLQTDADLLWNVVLSGWWFYIYNEVATIIIQKTSPVTQSVANTAKRAIVIVLGALVLGESLNIIKLTGCGIAIAGVFAYSEIDKFMARVAPRKSKNTALTDESLVKVSSAMAHATSLVAVSSLVKVSSTASTASGPMLERVSSSESVATVVPSSQWPTLDSLPGCSGYSDDTESTASSDPSDRSASKSSTTE